MPCIFCGGDTRVQGHGETTEPYQLKRYRKCLVCKKNFPTIEVVPEYVWRQLDAAIGASY